MSINDDYHAIDHQDDQAAKPQQQVVKDEGYSLASVAAIALLVGVFFAIAAAGIALGDSKVYNASEPYLMPNKAIVTATFKAPYFDAQFAQPVTVFIDHENERSRLEYYSGANTFITNKKANSTDYSIVPEYNQLKCFKNFHTSPSSLPTIFPKLQYKEGEQGDDDSDDHGPKLTSGVQQHLTGSFIRLYKKESNQELVNNILCDKWTYSYIVKGNATYEYLTPDEFGHAGNYTFYVNHKTGAPVQFHMIGHNVFNAGSHMEEYIVDYHTVTEVDTLPATLFEPPSGMPCAEDHLEVSKRHRSPVDIMTGSVSHQSPSQRQAQQDSLFESWSMAHQKLYENAQEKAARKEIFFQTATMIAAHNANPSKSYTMGLNQFADMTADELRMIGGRRQTKKADGKLSAVKDACVQYVPVDKELPAAVDWRTDALLKDYLNPDINTHQMSQISCGSCFSQGLARATGAQYYLKNGAKTPYDPKTKKDVSVQHLLDCSNGDEYDNHACNGGIDFFVASYIVNENSGKIAEDNSYGHFRNANGFCHYAVNDPSIENKNPWTGADVENFTTITACEHVGDQWNQEEEVKDLAALVKTTKNAVAFHGPLSISIAVPQSLYYYKSGVYDDAVACGHLNSDLTHTVTLVGYDDAKGAFIFMNSWSKTGWGVDGAAYIKMEGNVCGVATTPLAIYVEKI